MASVQRSPRNLLIDAEAEYQQLAEQHSKYEAELAKLETTPYISSEALLEKIKLKKMKLYCKDEMQRIAAALPHRRAPQTQ